VAESGLWTVWGASADRRRTQFWLAENPSLHATQLKIATMAAWILLLFLWISNKSYVWINNWNNNGAISMIVHIFYIIIFFKLMKKTFHTSYKLHFFHLLDVRHPHRCSRVKLLTHHNWWVRRVLQVTFYEHLLWSFNSCMVHHLQGLISFVKKWDLLPLIRHTTPFGLLNFDEWCIMWALFIEPFKRKRQVKIITLLSSYIPSSLEVGIIPP